MSGDSHVTCHENVTPLTIPNHTIPNQKLPPFIPPEEPLPDRDPHAVLDKVIAVFEEATGQPATDDAYHNAFDGISAWLADPKKTELQILDSAWIYTHQNWRNNKSVGKWGSDISAPLTDKDRDNIPSPPWHTTEATAGKIDPYSVDSIAGRNFTLKGKGNTA